MAAMPFLCNGIFLFQCNLPRVLPVLILQYASYLFPYIDSFLFLCGEWYSWSSLAFKDLTTQYNFTLLILPFAAIISLLV